jgi:HEAT repeat protein
LLDGRRIEGYVSLPDGKDGSKKADSADGLARGRIRCLQALPMILLKKLQLMVGSPETRVRALEELSHSTDPGAVTAIAEVATKERDPAMQLAAARALRRMRGRQEGVDALVYLLEYGPSEVQREAAEALAHTADVRTVQPLVATLNAVSREVNQAVVKALVRIGAPAVPALIRALSDASRGVKNGAEEALGRIGSPAVAPLIDILRNRDHPAQQAATDALVRIGRAAVGRLSEALWERGDHIRLRAAEALGRIGDPGAIEALQEVLQNSCGTMRNEAAKALKALGWAPPQETDLATQAVALGDWNEAASLGPAAVAPLIAALKDPKSETRRGAVQALAKMGRAAVVPLLRALGDRDPVTRSHAAQALGIIKDERAVEPLTKALQDPDASVRENAVLGLWQIGGERAAGALITALQDEDRLLRFRAARALEAIGDHRAVEALIEIANADDYVRPAAAMALARIAPARAARPLTQVIADDFTAAEGVEALTRVLEQAAGQIAPEDLRAVVQLQEVGLGPSGNGDRGSKSRPVVFVKAVNCSRPSRLAQEELTRRGLEGSTPVRIH